MVMKMVGTVLFEKKYNTQIKNFSTTSQVNKFVEKEEGKKLDVVVIKTDVVTSRGDILPMLDENIDEMFDKAIKQ